MRGGASVFLHGQFSVFSVISVERVALLVVSVVGLIAAIDSIHSASSLSSERAAVVSAQAAAAVASHRADSAIRFSDSLRLVVSHTESVRDSALRHAAALAARATVRDTVFHLAAGAAPNTCASVVAAAEASIATKDSIIDSLHVAIAAAGRADTTIAEGADSLRAALVSLRDSTATLSRAAGALAVAAKPSLLARFERLLPKPGIGVSVGVTPAGQPQIVTGITFGWALP